MSRKTPPAAYATDRTHSSKPHDVDSEEGAGVCLTVGMKSEVVLHTTVGHVGGAVEFKGAAVTQLIIILLCIIGKQNQPTYIYSHLNCTIFL